jgi:hypothetical protein
VWCDSAVLNPNSPRKGYASACREDLHSDTCLRYHTLHHNATAFAYESGGISRRMIYAVVVGGLAMAVSQCISQ